MVALMFCPIRMIAQSQLESVPVINARHWNPQEDIFTISGQCLFFSDELVDPASLTIAKGTLSKFPSLINDNHEKEGTGCGTFFVQMILPDVKRKLALYIPQIYSSYKLWINDSLFVETGKVAITKNDCEPKWLPRIISFENESDTLDLVIQVCNFHHTNAGIKEYLLLGTESKIHEKNRINIVATLSEGVILILIGLVFILTFIFSQQKNFVIFFALLSITWAIRSLFSNQYLYVQYNPDFNWSTLVRIEYITIFLMVIWGTLSVSSLYKEEASSIVRYFLVGSNIIFILFTLSVGPREFTGWLSVYLGTAVLLLLYVIVIAARAIAHRKPGIYLLATSILVGVFIFGYDIAVYKLGGQYNPVIFSLGYITIFVLIGFNLALQINVTTSKPNPYLPS